MSEHLQREIERLKDKILFLGKTVQESLSLAIQSVKDRDPLLARKIIEKDIEIDRMEVDTEEECLKILALYQPVAIDLRFIIGVLKMNSDLERIGDLAANIAERSVDLASERGSVSIPRDIFKMAGKVNYIVENSMKSMVNMDAVLARKVCDDDDEIDALHRKIFEDAKVLMAKDKSRIETTTLILSISRYMERIADHATNIGEDVIYMVEGIIPRHVYKLGKNQGKPAKRK